MCGYRLYIPQKPTCCMLCTGSTSPPTCCWRKVQHKSDRRFPHLHFPSQALPWKSCAVISTQVCVAFLFPFPLRGPAFGRGRMSCGEHGVNGDCCFLSSVTDEPVDCRFSSRSDSVAASTSTKHTRHDSQDRHITHRAALKAWFRKVKHLKHVYVREQSWFRKTV